MRPPRVAPQLIARSTTPLHTFVDSCMWRRTVERRNLLYKFWRRIADPVREVRASLLPDAKQPFGPKFGLTVYEDFVNPQDAMNIRQQYVDLYLRETAKSDDDSDVRVSDGRLHLPPLHPSAFASVLHRLERFHIVPPNYLNNQTVNVFQAGDFIRAHVDNMFIYDDIFAVISLGCPALLKLTHVQNGEELECLVPDCSVYIMEGPSRYIYFHSVLPLEAQRLSIVLRRSFLRSTGTFGPVPSQSADMLPHRGNAIMTALAQRQIGCTRIALSDEWLEENNISMFDAGEMVKRLKPLRDWSLQSQLAEDRLRYEELRNQGYLKENLDWRFDELKAKFRQVEEDITINKECLVEHPPPGKDTEARATATPAATATKS